MTFARFIAIAEVWRILDACAPGYIRRKTRDHYRVSWNSGPVYNLSCGPHGAPERAEIPCSDVRKMGRKLNIYDCVIARLPQ